MPLGGTGINVSYTVAVEGVEHSRDVASQDPHRDPGVVQGQPAAARLLRAMAAEKVIAHRAQHTHLNIVAHGHRSVNKAFQVLMESVL